jgi:hypothetical protein
MTKKLYITKKEAIKQCKQIWVLVLEGKVKNKAEANSILGNNTSHCPLCQYVNQILKERGEHSCIPYCPLYTQLHLEHGCATVGCSYYTQQVAKQVMRLK